MVSIHAPHINKFVLVSSQPTVPQSRMKSLVHLLKDFLQAPRHKKDGVMTDIYSVTLKVTGDSAKLNYHSLVHIAIYILL